MATYLLEKNFLNSAYAEPKTMTVERTEKFR